MGLAGPKVIIDIFMTDQWASGPYMVEAVKVLPKEVQEVIEIRTWNVKELEGIRKKKELGARVVPSIGIDGKIVFQSGIPDQDSLLAAIQERLSQ